MKKKAVITISDRHEIDGEFEEANLTTVGEYEQTAGGCSLVYDELGDFEGSTTTISLECGKITMQRSGDHCAELIIEKDKRYSCMYATEFADLTLGVFGKEVRSRLEENCGELFFSYTLDFNTGFCSQNELKIEFRCE